MNIIEMRNISLLPLLICGIIMLPSCKDTFSHDDEAKVEIILQAGSFTNADVRLNYVTASGNAQSGIVAAQTSERHYEAVLPSGCTPAQPFIEVRLDTATYHYTASHSSLEGGQRYTYSLPLYDLPEIGTTIKGWEVVETEVVIAQLKQSDNGGFRKAEL